MTSPVADSYSTPSGGSIVAGRFASALKWGAVPDLSFPRGAAASLPIHDYLPDAGSLGQALLEYVGALPTNVTFDSTTGSFVYTGVGGPYVGAGNLKATVIPCLVELEYLPTQATYTTPPKAGAKVQTNYPYSFSHVFNDLQVLPGTQVYCLTVKTGPGRVGDRSIPGPANPDQLLDTFCCTPVDYYSSGCLKTATLSGTLDYVFNPSAGDYPTRRFELIAVSESLLYGPGPVQDASLNGTVSVVYENASPPVSSTSNSFIVRVL